METSEEDAVRVELEDEAEDRARLLPLEDKEWALGGRLMAFESRIREAWKFESEPMENQLPLETPDFWLTLDRAEVVDLTDRPDSELMEDKAGNISKADGPNVPMGKYER